MSSSPNLPSALQETIPWNPDPEAIWLASALILRRNLANHHFPSKLVPAELDQVQNTLKEALLKSPELTGAQFFSQKQLSTTDQQLLYEHYLFLQGIQEPPNGAGFVLNDKGDFIALINLDDHLEMRALNKNGKWEETWSRLAKIEDAISKSQGFAFNPKFGYLTSDPGECGTGLTLYAYLHLPALIHTGQLQTALNNAQDPEVQFLSLSGGLEEIIGDLIIVENSYTLGMSEEAILHAIQSAVTKLVSAEKMMRQHLKEEQNAEIKDQVSKAFGVLCHSHQLGTKEALDLLSMMKLGLSLDMIANVDQTKLNKLFFKCRRGHLTRLFPDLTGPAAIEQKRADYLQQELSGISIKEE